MSAFDFDPVDLFTAGAIGEPGQRVFYVQVAADGVIVTLKAEKGQVAALAAYLAQLLSDLPAPDAEEIPGDDDLDLIEPVADEWAIGQLAVAYDDSSDCFVVRADELADETADDPDADPGAGTGVLGGTARFVVTRAQAHGFVVRSAILMAGGRPPCPLCGRPIDAEGHMCVKTNGHHPS